MTDQPEISKEGKRKRNDLSYEKKLEIVDALKNCDEKHPVSVIAKRYGLKSRHVQKLREDELKIREVAAQGEGRKRVRKTKGTTETTCRASNSQNVGGRLLHSNI